MVSQMDHWESSITVDDMNPAAVLVLGGIVHWHGMRMDNHCAHGPA